MAKQVMREGDWDGNRRLTYREFVNSALAQGLLNWMESTKEDMVGAWRGYYKRGGVSPADPYRPGGTGQALAEPEPRFGGARVELWLSQG